MLGNSAAGFPHPSGLIDEAPLIISDGTDGSFLAQNQTVIFFSFLSMTYQPPPTELKEGP